jgi:hypothetical protein
VITCGLLVGGVSKSIVTAYMTVTHGFSVLAN